MKISIKQAFLGGMWIVLVCVRFLSLPRKSVPQAPAGRRPAKGSFDLSISNQREHKFKRKKG